MIGSEYREVLTSEMQECLLIGIDICLDECMDDLARFHQNTDIENTRIRIDLPHRYITKYDYLFMKKFVVCLSTIAWKLTQDNSILHPACVAEELAAWMIIQQAESQLELRDVEHAGDDPYGMLIDLYYEDTDFLYLYDDAKDGIEESSVGEILGITPLAFDTWFTPFRETEPVHPYVIE